MNTLLPFISSHAYAIVVELLGSRDRNIDGFGTATIAAMKPYVKLQTAIFASLDTKEHTIAPLGKAQAFAAITVLQFSTFCHVSIVIKYFVTITVIAAFAQPGHVAVDAIERHISA